MENSTDDEEKNTISEKIQVSSDSESSTNCEQEELTDTKSWSRQEDAILLENIKKEYSDKAFINISEMLGNRTVQQVNIILFLLNYKAVNFQEI